MKSWEQIQDENSDIEDWRNYDDDFDPDEPDEDSEYEKEKERRLTDEETTGRRGSICP